MSIDIEAVGYVSGEEREVIRRDEQQQSSVKAEELCTDEDNKLTR